MFAGGVAACVFAVEAVGAGGALPLGFGVVGVGEVLDLLLLAVAVDVVDGVGGVVVDGADAEGGGGGGDEEGGFGVHEVFIQLNEVHLLYLPILRIRSLNKLPCGLLSFRHMITFHTRFTFTFRSLGSLRKF